MAQQISDLVINLDVDSATFTEQIARIKGQLSGVANVTCSPLISTPRC